MLGTKHVVAPALDSSEPHFLLAIPASSLILLQTSSLYSVLGRVSLVASAPPLEQYSLEDCCCSAFLVPAWQPEQ